MTGAKSQSALVLNLLKEDRVVKKFPQSGSEEEPVFSSGKGEKLASRGGIMFMY